MTGVQTCANGNIGTNLYYGGGRGFPKPQGTSTTSQDFGVYNVDGYFANAVADLPSSEPTSGQYTAVSNIGVATTKAHNGLCFAIPIALVQRLNQGAYHPVYNPEGCNRFWRNTGAQGASFWYLADAKEPNSTSDCFTIDATNTAGNSFPFVPSQFGTISSAISGRPTNDPFLYYDAIYAGQVQDLRTSSNRQTTNELLNEYSRKGIAGTIRGKESVPFTKVFFETATISGLGNAVSATSLGDFVNVGDSIRFISADSSIYVGTVSLIDNSDQIRVTPIWTQGKTSGNGILVEQLRTSEYAQLPWQDIIGDPANIAATFPDGVYGQWIPVIPTGNSKNWPLNRKSESTSVSRERTDNNGVDWVSAAITINAVYNSLLASAKPVGRVELMQYSTPANPYVLADNAEVVGESGKAGAFCYYVDPYGASLVASLIGKVPVGDGPAPSLIHDYIVQGGAFGAAGTYFLDPLYPLVHDTLPLANNSSPTVKTFPYITQENSQYYLQWVYKEMIWDTTLDNAAEFVAADATVVTTYTAGTYYKVSGFGTALAPKALLCLVNTTANIIRLLETPEGLRVDAGDLRFSYWDGNGFGDDNKFNIVSGESTVLDDNGNSVLVGQKRVALPFFTGKAS